MKERPILFSAPMVRAILDGSKTQTRRIVKNDPFVVEYDIVRDCSDGSTKHYGKAKAVYDSKHKGMVPCPYGRHGDRLWVRETWAQSSGDNRDESNGEGNCAVYRATWSGPSLDGLWKPSIHMPRWASRITLEVVSVRVERLNQISWDDAAAEGWNGVTEDGACRWYKKLWETINGPGSWDANPFVWAIEFKKLSNP